MKVALVVPTHFYTGVYPSFLSMSDFPVGFAYIAAALKMAGHEVIGVNPNNCPGYSSARSMLYEKMRILLEEQKPQLIGLGGICTDYAFIKDAIIIIRALAPGVPIVCGGGIINHDSEFVFNLLKPDFCIIGDAEEKLVQLVECLETGNTSLDTILNLGYWQNGIAKFSESIFDYPPLESRVFPDYSAFDPEIMLANSSIAARSLYRYTRPYPRIMPFVAARGCPFKCTFCVHHKGPKYRARPMSDILQEIAQLYETYQFNILIILDELFAIDKKRLQEFCSGIMEGRRKFGWDFDWLFQTHANSNLGRHELMMAKDAGCYFFSYGMESASPKVLSSMNKKSRPEQICKAIDMATDLGIGFGGNYIFGDIAETPDTIAETMEFFLNNCIDMHVYVFPISPYPGSRLFEFCIQQGIIKDKHTYYETIDSVLYNMTSIPDNLWSDWIKSLIGPLNTIPHVITVEPLEVIQDTSQRDDNGITSLWLIKAQCPHCNVTRLFREPLGDDMVNSGKASFLTGCSFCGKRFKIAANKEGRYSGKFAQRSISSKDLRTTIEDSVLKLTAPKVSYKVLYISVEFARWQQARSWSYLSNFGFEEGFFANDINFLTVPAFYDLIPGDSGSWLSHLKAICDGKQFEQVWIEVVHNNLDDTVLSYIATLAPVRLAIIGESLKYTDDVYLQAPHLKRRHAKVVHRLKYMTHALAGDERDVEWLNNHNVVKTLWWVQAVPERAISSLISPAEYRCAFFSGALYGEREKWLHHPLLKGLIAKQKPLEEDAQLPNMFDKTNVKVVNALRSRNSFSEELLDMHVNLLRKIRKQSFDLWLKGLACGSAVVNLPSFYQSYAGRVWEGMAAGRPVISWAIPDRPKTNALFETGKEILLFSKDNPALLAEQINRVVTDSAFAEQLVSNATAKIRAFHTIESRIREIMEWIESGRTPVYCDEISVKRENKVVNSFYVDLWNDPNWSSPYPNTDEVARCTKILEFVNSYCFDNGTKQKASFRILDVGCGRGWLSRYLEKYGEYIGVEPVPGAVDIAMTLFPGRKFITGYTGDLLKSSPEKFDIIVSTEVVEHVPYNKQKAFVRDLHALLDVDGFLVLTTPRKEIYDYILKRGLNPQPVEDWLTEEELKNLVESNGFLKFGMKRLFYDASTGRFYLNPTDNEIKSFGLIALYQVWAFKKIPLFDETSNLSQKKQTCEISVITCNVDDTKFNKFKNNVTAIFGNDVQLIRINDADSIAEGYNRGIRRAYGKILIFCHDDIEFLNTDTAKLIKEDLKENDIVGVAGTSFLTEGKWISSGQPFTHGQVIHKGGKDSAEYILCVYGLGRDDTIVKEIQALDGLFFAVNRQVFENVQFDDELFDGFHLYDLDFTYSAYLKGARIIIDHRIHLLHNSDGKYNLDWKRYADRFSSKYAKNCYPNRFGGCILTKRLFSQSKETLMQEMLSHTSANRIHIEAIHENRTGEFKFHIQLNGMDKFIAVKKNQELPYAKGSISYLSFRFKSLEEKDLNYSFSEIFRLGRQGAIAECVQILPEKPCYQAPGPDCSGPHFVWPKKIQLSNENRDQGALLLMGTTHDGAKMSKAYFQISKKNPC
jgi:anaerobic magnesium-protoporphyrin IX monomethyl ester cyclase